MKASRGFTLIELIIVTAIIALLASIAIPKYAEVLRKSQEGGLRGNLGSMRSALQIYYADNEGIFPSCVAGADSTIFDDVLIPKYLDKVPKTTNGLHPPTNSVYCDSMMLPGVVHDGQGWYYDGTNPQDSGFGSVWVACDHEDSRGSSWTTY